MIEQFRFGRFDHRTVTGGYAYQQLQGKDAQWYPQDTQMDSPGSHWSVTICNYMRADAFILTSLRTPPQCVPSIFTPERHMLADTDNVVVIELRERENIYDAQSRAQTTRTRKISIRCPGYYLEKNSLFIEELGWYLTIASRVEPTRAQLVQDSRDPHAVDMVMPSNVLKPTPTVVFGDFAALVRNSIERSDRIQVRVGVPLDNHPRHIPEKIKQLRISVLDKDFVPFETGQMEYDPTLGEDALVLENIHAVFSEPMRTTFTDLYNQPNRTIYLDTQEYDTLSGPRCGVVLFADLEALTDYVFSHKAEALYDVLSSRVIGEASGYTLRKQLDELRQEITTRDHTIEVLTENLETETGRSKTYKKQRDQHEETIKRIQNHSTESLSYDAVMRELDNERRQLSLDRDKLSAEREELAVKVEQNRLAAKAGSAKAFADMIKSSWGIILVVAGAIPVILKAWNSQKAAA